MIVGKNVDEWIEKLINGHPLKEKDFVCLCDMLDDLLLEEPNIVRVDPPVCVIGDLHGQFYDLLHLFKVVGGICPKNSFLFVGDFVDRGFHSAETVQLLFALKVRYPDKVTLVRGNHECRAITQVQVNVVAIAGNV